MTPRPATQPEPAEGPRDDEPRHEDGKGQGVSATEPAEGAPDAD